MLIDILSQLRWKWLPAVLLSVIVGTSPVFAAENKGAVSGEANFNSKCARCHGTNGKGNGFQALALFFMFKMPDLTDSAYMQTRSDDVLFRAIKQGSKGGMPAFGLKLSEPEIKNMVVHIRSFTKTSGPAKSAGAAH